MRRRFRKKHALALPLDFRQRVRLRQLNEQIPLMQTRLSALKTERAILLKDVPPYRPRRRKPATKPVEEPKAQRSLF